MIANDRVLYRCRNDVADAGRNLLGAVRPQGTQMNIAYWLAGLIAVALSIYLTIALLKPEWFE
jgi:K+-transporting ATPase KdpF subunit